MKHVRHASFKTYLIEFLVYGLLVAAYYLLVLHLLGDWLARIFHHNRTVYAFVALGLIAGQGLLLEMVTTLLLALITPRGEDEG